MQFNNLQSNNTHNASFAPNPAAANQQQGANPQARVLPPLANVADLSANPAARNLQTYNTSSTPQGPTDSLAPDTWNAPEYQPIQPGAPYMEKLADEAMNTKKLNIYLKNARDNEELEDFSDAEEAYEKALKYTENAEHYKLYAGCLKEIYLALSKIPLTPAKDEAKERTYKEKAARAFYYLGDLYQKQGALKEAQAAYKVSSELALYETPLKALVDVARQLGDATELAAALEKLADFYAGKGVIASAIDKLKEAFEVGKSVKILEKLEVLYRQEGGEDALEKLADFYAEKGAITLAIEKLKEAFEARKSAKILEKLEDLYRQEGEENNQPQMHEIAIQRFELQLRQDPKNIGLYRRYAWFLKDIGKRNAARAVKERIDECLQQKLVKQKTKIGGLKQTIHLQAGEQAMQRERIDALQVTQGELLHKAQTLEQKVVKQKTKIGGLKQTIHLQAEKIHSQAGELQAVGKQLEFLNRQAIHLDFSHCPGMQDADFIPLLMHNHNPYAQSLNLAGCEHLTDAVLHILPERYENLQELNLTSCKGVTAAGLDAIAEKATQLKRLNLDYCSPGTTIRLLHKLNAKGIAFSIEGVVFERKPLELSQYKATLTDADLLQKLQENPEITTLNLSGCTKITDAGLAPLKNFQWLTGLSVQGCTQLTNVGLQSLAGLTRLTSLDLLYCNKFTDKGLQCLSGLTQLNGLYFAGYHQLTDAALQHLSGLTQLRELTLYSCNKLTDAGLQHLSGMKQLKRLYLNYCSRITDAGLRHLSGLTQLQSLNFYGCKQITDAGLRHLSGMKQLKILYLGACPKISNEGLQYLSSFSQLRELYFSYCKHTSDGRLQHLTGLTQITLLNFYGCVQITDAGLRHLSGLTQLQSLNFYACNQITDAGLQHLAGLTQLKTLDLRECPQLTSNAKEQLKKQIPGLTIIE